jgi:hypothetical protein
MPSPTANVTSNMVANLDYKRLRDGRLIALMLAAKRVPRMQAGRIRGGEMQKSLVSSGLLLLLLSAREIYVLSSFFLSSTAASIMAQ